MTTPNDDKNQHPFTTQPISNTDQYINNHEDLQDWTNDFQDEAEIRKSVVQVDDYYFHNIQFSLLYLVLFFIVCISCVYFYSFNDYNNRVILPPQSIDIKDFPFYKILTKYTIGTEIHIELELDYEFKNENTVMYDKLNVMFNFSLDKVHFKTIPLTSDKNHENINEEFYDTSNARIGTDKKITNYRDSNIGIRIYDYPFNFELYRKDEVTHEVFFDTKCKRNQELIFYSANYMQLCTKINKDNYYYGFDNKNQDTLYNKKEGKHWLFSNTTDSFPFFLSNNPWNQTSYGVLLLNSGPIQINMETTQISYEMLRGIMNFYIFSGPSTKEVILQLQNTISLPVLPYYSSLDWDYFNNKTTNWDIENTIEMNNETQNSIERMLFSWKTDKIDALLDVNRTEIMTVFLDPVVRSKDWNDISFINYLFVHKTNLLVKNEHLLDYLNVIGLIEGKYYYHYLPQIRPMIISTKSFISSCEFMSKWLKNIPFTYEGMKMLIKENLIQSIVGNPYTYPTFSPESLSENINDVELVTRWSQWLSILPLTSEAFIPLNKQYYNFRYIFSIYLYSYFVILAEEGGTIIRPIFFDLKPKTEIEKFLNNEEQFMLGSNIMVIPVTEPSIEYNTYIFPDEKFYNFYTGELVNIDGEGSYKIKIYQDQLPLFIRGGKITPLQLFDGDYSNISLLESVNMEYLKSQPWQILISLDSNFQASGRLLIDDFNTSDARIKKTFYKLLITATQRSMDMSIFFKAYSFKFKLNEKWFLNKIDKVVIYGFAKISVKKLTIINKEGRIDWDKSSFSFSQSNDMLIIENISIPLDIDTKILIL